MTRSEESGALNSVAEWVPSMCAKDAMEPLVPEASSRMLVEATESPERPWGKKNPPEPSKESA